MTINTRNRMTQAGLILVAMGAALGLFTGGYVLYGPGPPAGTVLPISPPIIVVLGFWAGVVTLVSGIGILFIARSIKQ